jgi:hypothetical protein
MLKRFFILLYLVNSLNFAYLTCAMEFALKTENLLNLLFKQVAIDYQKQIIEIQHEMQEVFESHPYLKFDTCDVRLFFPKYPPLACVNKQWNAFFVCNPQFLEVKATEEDQTLLIQLLDRDKIRTKGFIAINPFVYITQEQIENNTKNQVHLKKLINKYQTVFKDENQKTGFHLISLIALIDAPFARFETNKLFRQFFFNYSFYVTLKRSFFNHLIQEPNDETITIAVETPNFKINYEDKLFWEWYAELTNVSSRNIGLKSERGPA